MSTLPKLTEAAIRAQATQKSWARGLAYYEDGYVSELVWRDGDLYAEVLGSSYDAYRVHVSFSGDDIVDSDCTCPYDWGDDCKHIVAALLALMHDAQKVSTRPAISELVAELDRQQLAALVVQLADSDPKIVDEVERLAALMAPSDTAPSPA
jgi:uncharacterized Zn finger protein